jgi:signal transduction histidine kinase
MQQVVLNLVHNAIQASPSAGQVVVSMERTQARRPGASEDSNVVRLDVVDRGTGIAPEDVHRVFEPFFTTKAVGVGTGLGLSVSHGIVEEHGGWIAVTSEVGAGSRFSVYLPGAA